MISAAHARCNTRTEQTTIAAKAKSIEFYFRDARAMHASGTAQCDTPPSCSDAVPLRIDSKREANS